MQHSTVYYVGRFGWQIRDFRRAESTRSDFMSKIIGIEPGHDQLRLVAVMQGGEPTVIPEPGRGADDPIGGSDHKERRAPGGPGGEAAGDHEPRKHRVFNQAIHGAGL